MMEHKAKSGCGPRTYLLAAVAGLMASAGSALAHDSLGPTMGTWDRGAVNSFLGTSPSPLSSPWVRKYFAEAGQCLAIDMIQVAPFADLELVVISPDPSVRYRDNDGSTSCTNCPRVKIDPAPLTGYYTVIANHFAGSAVTADFIVSVVRQAGGNAACTTPTPAF